jgi:hypothetical protein
MEINFLIQIFGTATRADKPAVGAINRPLRLSG